MLQIVNNSHYFIDIYAIFLCENNEIYCILEVLSLDLRYTVTTINNKYKFIYLLQSLFAIYHLNHICNLYHNDLYYNNEIINIMLYDTYFVKQKNITNILFNDLTIEIPTYGIKIIDF